MFAAGLCVVIWTFVACSDGERQFPRHLPGAGDPELVTADDLAVFEAVIADQPTLNRIFGTSPPPPPPPGYESSAVEPRQVAEPKVQLRPYTLLHAHISPDPTTWVDLSGAKVDGGLIPQSAVHDFNRRNRRRAALTHFRPRKTAIVWTEKANVGSALYSLTLPGYSSSHDVAVVELSVTDSPMSGGGELLYLRKSGREWLIVAKQRTWIS